jgi:hypothetical protein
VEVHLDESYVEELFRARYLEMVRLVGLAAGYLPQVVVDVRRGDIMPAWPAPVRQQLVPSASAPLQAPRDRAHLILRHGLLTMLGALGQILEHQLATAERYMILPDGRQPEGAVLLGVLLPARPEEAEVYQADRGRQDPGPGQARAFQVTADDLADARQGRPELPDPVVLVLVPLLTP